MSEDSRASGSSPGPLPEGDSKRPERDSGRLAASPDTGRAQLLTCKACAVDVSVVDGAAPACPRCSGPLARPASPDGDAPEATLLEVRPSSAHTGPPPGSSALLPAGSWSDLKPPPGARAANLPDVPLSDSVFDTRTQKGPPPGMALPPPPAAQAPAKRLGPYELRRVLGKGGMGIVYEAWHEALGRTVALKVMSSAEAGEEELERFAREARAAAKLNHPNIVPIHEVGVLEGRSYFTMDLVRGRTLQELARSRTLKPDDAARLVAKVAHAIQFAHERGIIHRDLKPSNVLVDESGEAKVMDFGLAKDMADVSGLTMTGVAMGSPPYMPPEQARGDFRKVDAVSDVYGIGAILYECLTGGPPFAGKSVYDIIAKVLVEEPVPPRAKNEAVPYDLETICLKALEKEKWRRYPAAKDLASDLERHVAGRTIRAVRQGLTTRLGRGLERHRTQIFAVLLPMAVVAAMASLLLGSPGLKTSHEVAPPKVSTDAGPLARAAEALEKDTNPLPSLLELAGDRRPKFKDLGIALTFLSAEAETTRDRIEDWIRGEEPDALIPPGLLVDATRELAKEKTLSDQDFATTVHAWFLPAGEPLAELARRAALASFRGKIGGAATYRRALGGPATVLDPAIVVHANDTLLRDRPRAEREAVLAEITSRTALVRRVLLRSDVRRATSGDIRRSGAADPAAPLTSGSWTFPAVRWGLGADLDGAERNDPRPLARGLLHAAHHGATEPSTWPPTVALLAPDGERVAVAWLRFLYLLDERTGRVVRRTRLPGAAVGLQHHLGGGWEVTVFDAPQKRALLAADDGGQLVDLDTGRPIPALDLLPGAEDPIAADELRRLAVASLPELDDELQVVLDGPNGIERGKALRFERPPGAALDLGFVQPAVGAPATLCLQLPGGSGHLAAIEVREGVDPKTGQKDPQFQVAYGMKTGDLLLSARLPGDATKHAWFTVGRGGRTPAPHFTPAAGPIDWADVQRRAEAQLVDDDPNPWAVAFAGLAALRLAADQPARDAATRRVREAVASPHLTPWERVTLGCALDRHLLYVEADQAFTRALTDLSRDLAYVPELAGYGALDAGRTLGRHAEYVRVREGKKVERADVLATWRNAFAPVLAESKASLQYYERHDIALPAGSAAAPSPHKGVAGLDLLDVLRIDHMVRFQGVLAWVMAGFLITLGLRYSRHALRDLERIGAKTPAMRLALWWRRPWTRLTFAWPSYVTTGDKLAFVVLYLLLFLAFAVQDAGYEAIAAVQRRHAALLAGLPAAAEACPDPKRAAGDADAAYGLVWGLLGRGVARDPTWREPLDKARAALIDRAAPRDALLLVELALDAGDEKYARSALGVARKDPLLADEVAILTARLEGKPEDTAIQEKIAARSVRHAVALRFVHALARPLAPAPDLVARDRLVVGSSRWWSSVPRRVMDDMTGPLVGDDNVALLAFEDAFEMNLDVYRIRNQFFWLVPGSLVVLLASLFVRTPSPFEPLAIDRAPSGFVRLASILVPGLAQVMLGRSVRGLLLLAPFIHLGQKVFSTVFSGAPDLQVLALREFSAGTDGPSLQALAELTAENVSAIIEVRNRHTLELSVLLALLYVVSWIDLARLRRNLRTLSDDASRLASARRPPREDDGPDLLEGPALIVPVDSEPGSAPRAKPPGDGPFDATHTGKS